MDAYRNIHLPPDARALVLDLFVVHAETAFSSAELIRAGEAFSHSATAMRTAIARLRKEGRLQTSERGVYIRGPLADPWRQRIEGWRSAPSRRTAWTGSWLMAAARPSSMSRTAWRSTMRALQVEGFRQAPQGLWLRPDTLSGGVHDCRSRLADYGATAGLLTARLDGLDHERAGTASALWDVPGLASHRLQLLDRIGVSQRRLQSLATVEAAREALMIGRAAVRMIVRDPLLPVEWERRPTLDALVAATIPYDALGRELWLSYLKR